MELSQSTARALLRLRPSLYAAPIHRAQSSSSSPLATLARRNFTTTRSQLDDQSRVLSQFLADNKPETPRNGPPVTGSSSQPSAEDRSLVDDLLNTTLDGTKGVPGVSQTHTSRFGSPSAQSRPTRPSQQQSNTPYKNPNNKSTSMDDLLRDLTNTRSDRTTSANSRLSTSIGNAFASSRPRGPNPVQPLSISLGPSAGRTQDVVQGDTARAFRTLDIKCKRNQVSRDFNKQRFHERPGLKRKRLVTQRWRARFKDAFRGTVKMVNKMRKQGW